MFLFLSEPILPIMRRSELAIFQDRNTDITILKNHINALHEQLIISHNNLIQLRSFVKQPLLDDSMVRSYSTGAAYMIARQKIAIEYASDTLKSISDVFTIIGIHILQADGRLDLLWSDFGKNIYQTAECSLYRLNELMSEILELYEKIKKMISGVFLGSAVNL